MDSLAAPILLLILIPEGIMVTALGLLLFDIRLKGRVLVLIGMLQGFICYGICQLPVVFGLHVLLQVVLFALVITLILQLPYRVSLTAMMVGVTVYAVLEALFLPFLTVSKEVPLTEILTCVKIQFLSFIPQSIIMLGLIYLVYRYDIKLLSLKELDISVSRKWWRL